MSRIRTQRFIRQVYVPTLVAGSIVASPHLRRAAHVSRFRNGPCVIVEGVEGELWEGSGTLGSIIVTTIGAIVPVYVVRALRKA
jgi:hypothetical protein